MSKAELLAELEKGYALGIIAEGLRKIVEFYGNEMGRYVFLREEARVKEDQTMVEQYSKAAAMYETDIGNYMALAGLFDKAGGCVLIKIGEEDE
jgi:polyhydroxyalkanoate synthesis regulator protein